MRLACSLNYDLRSLQIPVPGASNDEVAWCITISVMKIVASKNVLLDGIRPLEEEGARIVTVDCSDREGLVKELRDADALLVRLDRIDRRVLEGAPKLKLVCRFGVGVELIDVGAAEKLGIYVANTPDSMTISVAEHTMLLLLAASRNQRYSQRRLEKGDFSGRNHFGRELYGKTIAIIGYGRIGREVARKCLYGFGMNVIVWDRNGRYELPESMTAMRELDDILPLSDYVSLHLPLNEETRNFCDAGFFNRMKMGSIFINTARGGEVVEEALIEALESGRLYAAGLDCFSSEPLDSGSRLYTLDNVYMTPHSASCIEETFSRTSFDVAENVRDVLIYHRRPRGSVNSPAHPRSES